MKRYTVRLRISDTPPDATQIKRSVEDALLRQPITFRLGAIAPAEDNIVLVEIASDAKRADLARILKSVESTHGTQVESIHWGWLVTGSAGKPGDPDADPYASAQAQAEETQEYIGQTKWIAIRQGIGCVFLLALVTYPVLILLHLLERRYWDIVALTIYMALILSGASFNPRTLLAHVSRIRCDQGGIEIKYWLRPTPRRKAWSEIQVMETGTLGLPRVCTLRTSGDSISFSLENLSERSRLIKTIIERASLHFVENAFGRIIYKRSDAD